MTTHRKMSKSQKASAKKSANKHGRKKPGLWENVNASKGKGPKAKKGKTRPGKRSKTKKSGSAKNRSRSKKK
jgi:hypothetical protein